MFKPNINTDASVWRRIASVMTLAVIGVALEAWFNSDAANEPEQFIKTTATASATLVTTGVAAVVVWGSVALFGALVVFGLFVAATGVKARLTSNDHPEPPTTHIEQ